MTYKRILTSMVTGLVCFAPAMANPTLPVDAKPILQAGDPYVNVWVDKDKDDGAIDILTAIDIAASPETIWAIMTNCDDSLVIVPDMKSCEVLETGPDGAWDIRKQKTKVNMLITAKVTFRCDYVENKSIKISKVSGDMKVQDGLWELEALPDGKTRVTYRARSAPNFPVSTKKLTKGAKKDLPNVLMRLRGLAESRANG